MRKNPIDVVKYLLYKCSLYGDLITNLKMQKLLYYVYVWSLINLEQPCFEEKFQAWPNGPVLNSVYQELKKYGSSPIDPDFSCLENEKDLNELENKIGNPLKNIIEEVYEKYGTLHAFQLVNITHDELSWLNARKGLDVSEPSNNELSDKDIINQHGQ